MSQLTKDLMLKVFENDETKKYMDTALKSVVPLLAQAGLSFAIPFISPLAISASSFFALKALEISGDKIGVIHDKISIYKEQKGLKGFLSRMVDPSLELLKRILPASEKTVFEILTDEKKLHSFFKEMLDDPAKRSEFAQRFKRYITGEYDSFEMFSQDVKAVMGTEIDTLALEKYNQFSSLFYNDEILKKITQAQETVLQLQTELIKTRNSDLTKQLIDD